MNKAAILVICGTIAMMSSISFGYPREGSKGYVTAEIQKEIDNLGKKDILVGVWYRVSSNRWGANFQKVGLMYGSEKETLDACRRQVQALGGKDITNFRYTYKDAIKLKQLREDAARRQKEAVSEAESECYAECSHYMSGISTSKGSYSAHELQMLEYYSKCMELCIRKKGYSRSR